MMKEQSILSWIGEVFKEMDKKILVVFILILLAILFQGAVRVILIIGLFIYLIGWRIIKGFFKE